MQAKQALLHLACTSHQQHGTVNVLQYLAVRLRSEVSARDLQGIVQAHSGLIMQVLDGLG